MVDIGLEFELKILDGGISMMLRRIILDMINSAEQSEQCSDRKFGSSCDNYWQMINELREVYKDRFCEIESLRTKIMTSKLIYEELNLTHPQIVSSMHKLYIDAGAKIITTNSFGVVRRVWNGYCEECEEWDGVIQNVYEICLQAALLAHKESNGTIKLMGSVGVGMLMVDCMCFQNNDSAERRYELLKAQILGLMDGGVDYLLFETLCSIAELEFAIYALDRLQAELDITNLIGDESIMPGCVFSATLSGNDSSKMVGDQASISDFVNICKNTKHTLGVGLNCVPLNAAIVDQLAMIRHELNDDHIFVMFRPNDIYNHKNSSSYSVNDSMSLAKKNMMQMIISCRYVDVLGGCCGCDQHYVSDIKQLTMNVEANVR